MEKASLKHHSCSVEPTLPTTASQTHLTGLVGSPRTLQSQGPVCSVCHKALPSLGIGKRRLFLPVMLINAGTQGT